jgi:hypothetical protein
MALKFVTEFEREKKMEGKSTTPEVESSIAPSAYQGSSFALG